MKEMAIVMKRLILLLLVIVLICGCSREISEDAAVSVAKEFVDEKVTFYTKDNVTTEEEEEEEGINLVEKFSIKVVDVRKVEGEYQVLFYVESNGEGEIKKKGFIVVVDSEKGVVIPSKFTQVQIK